MNRKYIILFCIAIFVCLFGINVYASTSSAVDEAYEAQDMISRYASGYDAPFVQTGGDIELVSGNVSVRETDLTLPGKNEFDINLVRTYYADGAPGCYTVGGGAYPVFATAYKYTYNGGSAWVLFNSEEELVDEFKTTSALMSKYEKKDAKSVYYYRYTDINNSSGSITFTRDKTSDTKELRSSNGSPVSYSANTADFEIADGWYIGLPQIYESSNKTKTNTVMYTRNFVDMDGKSCIISYEKGKGSSGEIDEDSITVEDSEAYTAAVYQETQTHVLGFSYYLAVTDGYGKTYYFAESTERAYLPVAVTDRYNNVVYYTRNSDKSVTITDTLGRSILLTTAGITVTANGKTIKHIGYGYEVENDKDRDPEGKLHIFATHKFTVSPNENDSNEKTVYIAHKKSIVFPSLNTPNEYSCKIEKIEYPTGAAKNFTYEDTAGALRLVAYKAGVLPSKFYDYHVAKESLSEDGTESSIKTYSYKYNKNIASTYIFNTGKTITVTEDLGNGASRNTKYTYDCMFRPTETETTGSSGTEGKKYFYTGNGYKLMTECSASTISTLRKAPVITEMTLRNDEIRDITYTEYNKNDQPTYSLSGEAESTVTYDDTYGFVLTSQTKKNGNTTEKITNTKTSDGKNIGMSKRYENNSLKATSTYTYDTNGEISSETVKDNSTGASHTTEYTHSYTGDAQSSVIKTTKNVTDADGNSNDVSTVTGYDALGNTILQTDGCGRSTVYTYDKMNRITKQTNPDGTSKDITYYISSNSVRVRDENGNYTIEDYTPLGRLETIYVDNSPSKKVASYTYDSTGRVTSAKAYRELGGNANITEYTYDDLDRVTKTVQKDGSSVLDTASYEYDELGGFVKQDRSGTGVIDVSGVNKIYIVIYNNSPNGNDFKIKRDGNVWKSDNTKYNSAKGYCMDTSSASSVTVTSSDNKEVYYKLISDEESEENVNLLGGAAQVTTVSYTGDSYYKKPTVKTVTDGYGNTVSETYYKHGTTTVLNKNTYKYDYMGNVIEMRGGRTYTENLGDYTTKTEYDYMGNATKTYRADGTYTTAKYDAFGNMLSATDYLGNTTNCTYDALNRVITQSSPFDGDTYTKTLTFYDKNGNIIETREQNNDVGATEHYKVTNYEYDSRNRLITQKVNDGKRDIYTQYAYDNVGNPVKVVNGQTSKISDLYGTMPSEASWTNYEYDQYGNVTKTTDALGYTETASYNLMGLATESTDKNGNTTTNTYNAYGKVLTSTVGDDTITNTYSKNGLLISAKNANCTISYTYDNLGNIASETTGSIKNTYTYDTNGNRKTFTQKEGSTTYLDASYTYDSLDRMTGVDFGNVSAIYTYDANDRLLTEDRGTVTSTYTYNNAGLVTSLNNSAGNSYTNTYRLDGKKRRSDFSNEDYVVYGYNDLGQLTYDYDYDEYFDNYYQYDTRGNRTLYEDYSNCYTTKYTYDKNNRLLTEKQTGDYLSVNINTAYTYDNNGNVLTDNKTAYSITDGSESWMMKDTYTYNSRNQMITDDYVEADYTDGGDDYDTYDYTYDALGRLYGQNNYTLQWDGYDIVCKKYSGNLYWTYYRGANLIAQNYYYKTSSKTTDTLNYFVYNDHNDTTAITDSSGTVTRRYLYDGYGKTVINSGTGSTYMRYNGQLYDNSGLIYLRNRWYDTSTGRFTQEDPAKDGINWYVYCDNDPVNFVDPWGLKPGDLFLTEDEAAIDAGTYFLNLMYDKESEYYNQEVTGYIYPVEGGYTYKQVPNTNEDKSSGFETKEPIYDDDVIHTHIYYGNYINGKNDVMSTPNNVNTNAPSSDIDGADNGNYKLYMASPTGVLKKYVPGTYKVGDIDPGEVVSSDLPKDINYVKDYFPKTLLYQLIKQKYPNITDEKIFELRSLGSIATFLESLEVNLIDVK